MASISSHAVVRPLGEPRHWFAVVREDALKPRHRPDHQEHGDPANRSQHEQRLHQPRSGFRPGLESRSRWARRSNRRAVRWCRPGRGNPHFAATPASPPVSASRAMPPARAGPPGGPSDGETVPAVARASNPGEGGTTASTSQLLSAWYERSRRYVAPPGRRTTKRLLPSRARQQLRFRRAWQ